MDHTHHSAPSKSSPFVDAETWYTTGLIATDDLPWHGKLWMAAFEFLASSRERSVKTCRFFVPKVARLLALKFDTCHPRPALSGIPAGVRFSIIKVWLVLTVSPALISFVASGAQPRHAADPVDSNFDVLVRSANGHPGRDWLETSTSRPKGKGEKAKRRRG